MKELFQNKQTARSIYFPINFPEKDNGTDLAKLASENGVDFIELGLPYSDPLADGETIQECSSIALRNGANFESYFSIAKEIKEELCLPTLFMGYFNQVLQFGVERFAERCIETGIKNVIIPDLPLEVFYKEKMDALPISFIFLITPNTSVERIKKIDELSNGFIYCVADNSITGAKSEMKSHQIAYFEKLRSLNLKNPLVAGFGISNKEQIETLEPYVDGVIIGSAFLKSILKDGLQGGETFLQSLNN